MSSRLHRNPVLGEMGRYKIGPYTGCGDVEVVANEEEGTSPSPTKLLIGYSPAALVTARFASTLTKCARYSTEA